MIEHADRLFEDGLVTLVEILGGLFRDYPWVPLAL